MKVAAIICEYNPMHLSHVYHIEKTREILGEDTGIVCIMSGDFVQRGEPAVMNKFARSKAAVMAGADLVLELPLPWSVSSAEKFASAGVFIAENTGVCTHLSFGSEAGELGDLITVAEILLEENTDSRIKEHLKEGVSYAAARQMAVEETLGSTDIIKSPNNILAVEYLKAIKKLNSVLEPVTISRCGAGHDQMEENGGVSASFLREEMKKGEDISEYVPAEVYKVIEDEVKAGRCPVSMEKLDSAIMACLRRMDDHQFSLLPDSSEGLYMRLYSAAVSQKNVQKVMEKAKTKRYAMSRIRRMIICAYLGIIADDVFGYPPYIRVLAMGKRGRDILKEMKEKSRLPVITKPGKVKDLDRECRYIFDLGSRGENLYNLAYDNEKYRVGDTDYKTSPYVMG